MTSPSWAERYAFAQAAIYAASRAANGAVYPVWLDDNHFWYERRGQDGAEYCIVDAATGARRVAVTRTAIAAALSERVGTAVDPEQLIVSNLRFDLARDRLAFQAYGEAYEFALGKAELVSVEKQADVNWLPSPDPQSALVLRDGNLWLRDVGTGHERRLTTDGCALYAYGEPPAAMRGLRARAGNALPEALWSPDGRWVFTLQTDDRHVPELSLAEYAPVDGLRPKIHANRTSLPPDPKVTEFRMIAIEAATGRQVEARYPRLSAVRMNTTPFSSSLAWWSADSQTAYFVDIERGEQKAHVVAFDAASGATRVVFSEETESYVEVGVNVYTPALTAALPETNELVWYSERTGRGHLYLYDLVTGALRNPISEGDWQVAEILRVDAKRREVIFLAAGIGEDEGPYVAKPCIASLDGGGVRVLSAEPGQHLIWRGDDMGLLMKRLEGLDPSIVSGLSPTGDHFVETVSTVQDMPRTILRRRDGGEVAVLETGSAELPEGWIWPEPFKCLAADGRTETFGLLFKPLGYDPARRYPVIDYIYGGPQISNVPRSSFADGGMGWTAYLEGMHLSALGAFVLILDGRGTAQREQAFRTASHRAAHTASNLEDHVAALRQLAQERPQMDLERVGITGFSGGGYMAAHAALRFGEVFKVAVAGGGNYDQALFWHSWGERYHGAYDAEHYATQAAKTYAAGLTGKLMLVHGMMDEGCHPAALFQLVQALIEANKDPDLVLLPRAGHDWTGYGMRRRWDYLATHLIGEVPPPTEPFRRPFDDLMERVAANAAGSRRAE